MNVLAIAIIDLCCEIIHSNSDREIMERYMYGGESMEADPDHLELLEFAD